MSVGAIQRFIDDLADRMQRSVVVDDDHVRVLYTSRHFGDEDEVRQRAVLQRDAGAEIIGYVLSQGVMSWSAPGVIPANEELGLFQRTCVPIRWRGTLLGLLMVVDREGSLTQQEMSMITEAGQDLASLMLGEHGPGIGDESQAVADALDDLVAPEVGLRRAAIRSLTTLISDPGERHVRCLHLVAHGDHGPGLSGHVSAAFRHALAAPGTRPVAWMVLSAVHEHSALALITCKTEISDDSAMSYARELVDRVDAVASERFTCVVGVGGAGVGLDQVRGSAQQSELAARAARIAVRQPVVAWAELGELAVLLRLPLADMDDSSLPDEVQRLLTHDKDGRTLETVQAFLEHAGSAPETADALHLHRTTLYYRLERIREATGLDLNDGRTRLAVHIGIRLRDLMTAERDEPAN